MIRYFDTKCYWYLQPILKNVHFLLRFDIHQVNITHINYHQPIKFTINIIFVFIQTIQMSYATERCTGFVCSYFEFLKLNVKYNDVKYAIVYSKITITDVLLL